MTESPYFKSSDSDQKNDAQGNSLEVICHLISLSPNYLRILSPLTNQNCRNQNCPSYPNCPNCPNCPIFPMNRCRHRIHSRLTNRSVSATNPIDPRCPNLIDHF